MITGDLRSKIDQVWNAFWAGGIANPLEVIEQITYLLFMRGLDDAELREENRTHQPMRRRIFPDGRDGIGADGGVAYADMRWSKLLTPGSPAQLFEIVAEHVFPFLRGMAEDGTAHATHMKGARFTIPSPALLVKVVDLIDRLPMADRDTKGDLYEHMLGKIASAGQNGQFRTPRHIIALMVEMTAPTPKDVICDPACGTCGFLVAAREYMMRLRANSDRMRLEVCIALLQTDDVKRQILGRAKNAVNQSSINQGDVKGILLPLPTMEAQRAFRQAMRAIEVTRTRLHGGVSASSTLFSSLQSRAFSGQI